MATLVTPILKAISVCKSKTDIQLFCLAIKKAPYMSLENNENDDGTGFFRPNCFNPLSPHDQLGITRKDRLHSRLILRPCAHVKVTESGIRWKDIKSAYNQAGQMDGRPNKDASNQNVVHMDQKGAYLPYVRVGGIILVGPGLSAIDGIPVYSQPLAHLTKAFLIDWGDFPIGCWSCIH